MSESNGNLAKLDLNLLTALQALLHHKSVSNAADAVGRTQSAMSHALARLRHHFQDPLLVRNGWAMELTPVAQNMAPEVAQVAASVAALFDGARPFVPSESTRRIRIATRDICAPLLTPLIGGIARAGPRLSVEIVEAPSIRAAVAANEADIGFGFGVAKETTTLAARFVGDLTWCVFAPEGHAYAKTPDAATWAAASHVVVGPPSPQPGPVEAKAEALGVRRHIMCRAPNFSAAMDLAADCNALFTTLKEPFCRNGPPANMVACPMPFSADAALPPAPAVVTLRKSWGDPFEAWLSSMCDAFLPGW